MSYWGRGITGIAMTAAGIALSASGLYHLLLVGTCASGGPFEIARPCPDGTGLRVLMLVAGIFLALIGMFVAATRRFDGERAPLGLAAWCAGFGALALTFLHAGLGPDAPADDPGWKLFCGLMGGFFALFALVPPLFTRWTRSRQGRVDHLVRDGRRADAVVTAVHDTGVALGETPRVRVELEVRPDGGPPFGAEKTVLAPRAAIPRVGDRATVWYDPADREQLAVAFDGLGAPEGAERTG